MLSRIYTKPAELSLIFNEAAVMKTKYMRSERSEMMIILESSQNPAINGTISDNMKIKGIKCLILSDPKRFVLYNVMRFQKPLLKLFEDSFL